MTKPSLITNSLLTSLRSFDRPATSAEIESMMNLGLHDDPVVATERVRIALALESILTLNIKRLPDDRWIWEKD